MRPNVCGSGNLASRDGGELLVAAVHWVQDGGATMKGGRQASRISDCPVLSLES